MYSVAGDLFSRSLLLPAGGKAVTPDQVPGWHQFGESKSSPVYESWQPCQFEATDPFWWSPLVKTRRQKSLAGSVGVYTGNNAKHPAGQ